MRFNDITSITGKSGLFEMKNQRPDGMIVTSLNEGWTRFVSSRNHMFTPLRDIAIYTDTDTVALLDVLLMMYDKKEELPIPGDKPDELKTYMETLLPDYDRDRVYVSDMKKLMKWYRALDEKGVILTEKEEAAKAPVEEEADTAPEKEKASK
jgi:hypothetical protein